MESIIGKSNNGRIPSMKSMKRLNAGCGSRRRWQPDPRRRSVGMNRVHAEVGRSTKSAVVHDWWKFLRSLQRVNDEAISAPMVQSWQRTRTVDDIQWSEVRKLFPDQYVFVEDLKSKIEGRKLYIEE